MRLIKKCTPIAMTITTLLLAIVPESLIKKITLTSFLSEEANIILNRSIAIVLTFLATMILCHLYEKFQTQTKINGKNYNVVVEYGDIFKINDCKKIIPFDECFTTKIGDSPANVNLDSICGQYLKDHPINDMQMQNLITIANLCPTGTKSAYQNKTKYDSGFLIPKDDFLLMSFVKLNSEGLGTLSFEEFLKCLNVLWKEIDKYYGQQDVCIPILGSGVTRFEGGTQPSKQELIDIILCSYKISQHKIKLPNCLRIVCRKSDDFSLNRIDN